MKSICLVLLSMFLATYGEKKIVCYWGSWSFYRTGAGAHKVSNINPSLCTHYIYTFSGLDIDGKITSLDKNLDLTNQGFKTFIDLKNKQGGQDAKIILAIGGWNEGSLKYSVMSHDATSRKTFAGSVLRFLTFYGFDGIDIDWEYPTERGGILSDKENFTNLIKELKETLSPWGLSVSLAVSGSTETFNKAYDINEICKYADFISIMGYDLQSSDLTSHHSEISKIQPIVEKVRAVNNSCLKKLILGVPTYGRSFTLKNPKKNNLNDEVSGVGRPGEYTKEGGFLGYNEICELKKKYNAQPQYDDKGSTVYVTYDDQWITYDDKKTAMKKVDYVNKENLGGMMVWTLDTDDFRNKCGEGTYPILKTIQEHLK
ncbi:CHIA family protein [Megaselia abdita]